MEQDETDFSLKEWAVEAKISRQNTRSRRFSESNLKNIRETARSFRSSNITFSSTASSPCYTFKGEIDPSTYSFTTALKALKAKTTVYNTLEYLSADGGLTLNSKWNDAEKYICNPLSGQVPLECLSSKSLSGRSRITMSAPLIYPSLNEDDDANSRISQHQNQIENDDDANGRISQHQNQIGNEDDVNSRISRHQNQIEITSKDKKMSRTRDVGTQSTPVELSSGSPSPAQTPSIGERSIKISESEYGDSSVSSDKSKSENEYCTHVEVKETKQMKEKMMSRCSYSCGREGCVSLRCSWITIFRLREKHKPCKDTKHN